MWQNITGYANVAMGVEALSLNSTGWGNAAFGRSSLLFNTSGNLNSAFGAYADVGAAGFTNATAIGSGAIVSTSDKVRIGNPSVMVIEGQVGWSFPSDARFKYNIHEDHIPGLSFIEKLRPVSYQFDTRKYDEHLTQNMPDEIRNRKLQQRTYSEKDERIQTGFLAQEVEQACRELGFDFSGLHVPTNETDNYSLAYGSFVPHLVKAMQEQQLMIDEQKSLINALQLENAQFKAHLAKISQALVSAGIVTEQ
jgi:hypothetical protein